MIKILGTSHISPESIKQVEKTIEKESPDIIAIELDRKRFFTLTSKGKKRLITKNISALVLGLIGAYLEKKLGKIVGTKPGDEMKKAISIAKEKNIELQLIDQDINITLKKLTKIPRREKFKVFWDILTGFFKRKEKIEFDLAKVPKKELILKILDQVKRDYPSIHDILIEQRNNVMANNLKNIFFKDKDKKILAIVGAGHVSGIKKILSGN
jgi:pheromone shutdown-related protein TraB